MHIADHALFDALCGEYIVGTLRGAARRRFERALRDEPLARSRLDAWLRFLPQPAASIAVQPSREVWRRLERGLDLDRYREPWYRRFGFWIPWTASAVVALLIVVGYQLSREPPLQLAQVAELSGKEAPSVSAFLSRDRRTLVLRASRQVTSSPNHSYELWLIPEGGKPISLAVLHRLDIRVPVPPAQIERLRAGAALAISLEPPNGSPTGQPTGPVILAGKIGT